MISFKKNYVRSPLDKGMKDFAPSMTKQEFEPELEINQVMKRYVATGYIKRNEIAGTFGDFSVPLDFDAVQDKILHANALFIDLPIDIKDEFRTASEFLKAFQTPTGRARLEAVGVLSRKDDSLAEMGNIPSSPTPTAKSQKAVDKQAPTEQPAS